MNGNQALKLENNAACMNGQPGMASALTDCRGPRPDNLLSGHRTFPDQERANLWSPCSNCSSDENNSPTALNSFNWDKPALEDKSVDFGWSSPQDKNNGKSLHSKSTNKRKHYPVDDQACSGYVNMRQVEKTKVTECITSMAKNSPKKEKQLTQGRGSKTDSSLSESIYPVVDHLRDNTDCCELPSSSSEEPESTINERSEEEIEKEKEDLKNVAWFQAGIPREIALEVLNEKPEGSFIVRKSTTKPGCYALSLRVPAEKNPTGIAHYLILQTNKGYKIKGFTKEFSSLHALITHHSVMPELLPCPLNVSRQSTRDAEREFEETEQKTCDLFSDIHWLMTDLEL